MLGIDWVLDWNRIANLIIVLLPFFLAVAGGCKYILDRADRKEKERHDAEDERREAEEERRAQARAAEIAEMREAREDFYAAIKQEAERSAAAAERMRALYEAELDRAITLRSALAEAAQRETRMQEIILQLKTKIDSLQREIAELRERLDAVPAQQGV